MKFMPIFNYGNKNTQIGMNAIHGRSMTMVDSIAAMSMNMSAAKLQMNVGVSLTKKVMDTQEVQAAGLLEMMDAASSSIPAGDLGQILDVTG